MSRSLLSIVTRISRACFVAVLLALVPAAHAGLVTWQSNGACTLANDTVTLAVDRTGVVTSLRHGAGPNLISSVYLTGTYLASRSTVTPRLVRDTPDLAEVSYTFTAHRTTFDLRYIIRTGDSGFYCTIAMAHPPAPAFPSDAFGFAKQVLQADPALFNQLQSTATQQGFIPPPAAILEDLGDNTYRLDPAVFTNDYNPSYFSKYDYMHYAREHGAYGLYSAGAATGLYVLNAGNDWIAGGPTKNLQTVHDTATINNIINDQHLLPDSLQAGTFPAGTTWRKTAGPWFFYVAPAADAAAGWAAAQARLATEFAAWPYAWMAHDDYPTLRTRVTGTLHVTGGSAAGAWVVLSPPGADWQDQCLGYTPWTRADATGRFEFPAVRAGTYVVHAYGGSSAHPRRDNPFNEFHSAPFTIAADLTEVALPDAALQWTAHTYGPLAFQIGIPDRSTREFKLGDLRRQYALWTQVPATIDYTVPPATATETEIAAAEAAHWYYLQTVDFGVWNIRFTHDRTYPSGRAAYLTFAFVGACKRPQLLVTINGTPVVTTKNIFTTYPHLAFRDDSSVRRCAVNGGYYYHRVLEFDAALLRAGNNTIALAMHVPGANREAGGLMFDALKLEVAPVAPAAPAAPAAATGDGTVTLTWPAVSEATAYTIERALAAEADSTFTPLPAATTLPASTAPAFRDFTARPGTAYRYRLLATNAAGTSPASPAVSVTPILTLAAWIATCFPLSTPAADCLPLADPDADGHTNLLEFYLGSSPTTADDASPLRLTLILATDSGSAANICDLLVIHLHRAAGLAGVTATLEQSPDLIHWTAVPWPFAPATDAAFPPTATGDWVTATLPVPPGGPRLFLRLTLATT